MTSVIFAQITVLKKPSPRYPIAPSQMCIRDSNKERRTIETTGNGRLDAVSNAIKMYFGISYELAVYEEHAISEGSSSKAAAYVEIICKGKNYWGVGIDAVSYTHLSGHGMLAGL